jgi:hypothetical protein
VVAHIIKKIYNDYFEIWRQEEKSEELQANIGIQLKKYKNQKTV